MEEVNVCKIPLENIAGQFITVYSQWVDCSFRLKIIHHVNAWEKIVSSDSVKSLSSFTQHKPEEYLLETKRALTTNAGVKDFTYSLIDSELTWKKIVDKDQNIRVKFGFLCLEKASISSVTETIFDFMLSQGISKEKQNNALEKENSQLKKVNSNLRTQIEELVSLKTEMEESLYAKFLLLLNAKKEKILELEQIINEQKQCAAGPSLKTIQEKRIMAEEVLDLYKGSDSYGSETDIDSDEEKHGIDLSIKNTLKDVYGSDTEIDTDEETFRPSTSKIQKLDPLTVLSPSEHIFKDASDDSATQLDFKDACDDSFGKDAFLPVRPKKNTKTRFSKETRDKKSDKGISFSEKQKIPVTDGEFTKSQQYQQTKLGEVKSKLQKGNAFQEHNNDHFDVEDLLTEM